MKAVAITDHECLTAHVRALNYYNSKYGDKKDEFKLILGNEIYLTREGLSAETHETGEKFYHMILLAKDEIGHRQLRELSSRAWKRGYVKFIMRTPTYLSDLDEIVGANPGHLICTTACFTAGTQVRTSKGYKNIEDINSSDYILNRYGQWEKVNFPTQREYKGKGYEIECNGLKKIISCTENHKFLVKDKTDVEPYWIEANKLNKKEHTLLMPLEQVEYSENHYLPMKNFRYSVFPLNETPRKILLPDVIHITPELMRLFGLFLGDGHITFGNNPRIGFTFNIAEFDTYYCSFIKNVEDQLGFQFSKNVREENHRVDLSSANRDLIELFFNIFGDVKADTKYIPDILKHISPELDYELIFGYFLADGYFRLRKGNGGEFVSASISKQLSYDFFHIINSCKLPCSLSINKAHVGKDGVNHRQSYYVQGSSTVLGSVNKLIPYTHEEVCALFKQASSLRHKDYLEFSNITYRKIKIKNIKEIQLNTTVHCLNVDSHSFVCENVVVHNCLGGLTGTFFTSGQLDRIEPVLIALDNLFGHENFYIELQPSFMKDQINYNNYMLEHFKDTYNFSIATDSHYLKKEDREIHKTFLNSKDSRGNREVDEFYASAFMMSVEEVHNYMDNEIGVETVEALMKNTLKMAEMCKDYILDCPQIVPKIKYEWDKRNKTSFDKFKKEIGDRSNLKFYFEESNYEADKYLAALIAEGYEKLIGSFDAEYYDRLETELTTLRGISDNIKQPLSDYFNTMAKIIDIVWTDGDSLVGPGRGSGCGSLINYLVGITQLDPLRQELSMPFWRFLDVSRPELPDIDFDTESLKRNRILKAVSNYFNSIGSEVINICTIGTIKTKSAIRTAGRSLGIEDAVINYIVSLVPNERGNDWTLSQCMYGDEEHQKIGQFVVQMNTYPQLWKVANSISGLVSNLSVHASGVLILNGSITEHNSIMKTSRKVMVTAWDLHDSEQLGALKYD